MPQMVTKSLFVEISCEMFALEANDANMPIRSQKENQIMQQHYYKTQLCFVTIFKIEMIVQDDTTVDLFIVEKKKKRNSKGVGTCLHMLGIKQLTKEWLQTCQHCMVHDRFAKIS